MCYVCCIYSVALLCRRNKPQHLIGGVEKTSSYYNNYYSSSPTRRRVQKEEQYSTVPYDEGYISMAPSGSNSSAMKPTWLRSSTHCEQLVVYSFHIHCSGSFILFIVHVLHSKTTLNCRPISWCGRSAEYRAGGL